MHDIDEMSPVELIEWMIYEQIEPFGDRRGDIQAGQLCAVLANIHRDPKTRPYTITDFVLDWEPRPVRPQTPEDQLQFMLMLQAAQNAKVNA